MGFRLVSKSVTLSDLKRRNDMFGTLAICQVKFYGDRPRGTPSSEDLNTRGIAEYSDFGPIERLSRKRCKIGGKLVVITNRKSHMSFRLVPNSVTLNDLERHKAVALRYFTEFGKHAFQHIPALICGGIYARVYCFFVVRVRCRHKKVHVRYLIS